MQRDVLQTDWSLLDPKVTRHGYQRNVHSKRLDQIYRQIDIRCGGRESVVNLWGDDTESWNDVCVWETMMKLRNEIAEVLAATGEK